MEADILLFLNQDHWRLLSQKNWRTVRVNNAHTPRTFSLLAGNLNPRPPSSSTPLGEIAPSPSKAAAVFTFPLFSAT